LKNYWSYYIISRAKWLSEASICWI